MTCARCDRDNWEIPECKNNECPYGEPSENPDRGKVSANDKQVGGGHYKVSKGVQHWDFVEEHGLGYLEGNATKYLSRWRNKNGLQDLEKSLHYVEKIIELAEAGTRGPRGCAPEAAVAELCNQYGLTSNDEYAAFRILSSMWTVETMRAAREHIQMLVAMKSSELI